MSASQFKFNEEHRIIYPGTGQLIGIKQFDVDIKTINDSTRGKVLDSACLVDDIKSVKQDASERPEDSFRLDWIEIQDEQRQSKRQSVTDLKKNKSEISNKRISLLSVKQSSLEIKQKHISSRDMQASHMNNSPSSGRHSIDQESVTLDMKDDVMNQQYHATKDDYSDDLNLAGQLTDGTPEVKQRLSGDYNQLDEPIMVTLMRDLSGIYNKMKIIALPLSSYDIYKIVLRGWDLWGPLLLCTFLAFNLHHSEYKDNHAGPHFADVFVLVWFGSCVVSLNYRLLSISGVNNQVQELNKSSLHPHQSSSASTYNSPKNITQITTSQATNATVNDQQKQSQHEAPFQTLLSPPSIFQLMCVFGYCLVAPCFGLIILKMFSLTRLFFERIIIGLLFGFAWPTFCSIRILVRYQHPEKRALAIYPIGLFYFVLSCMIILNH